MEYLIPQPIVDGSPHVFTYLVNGERVFVKKRRPNKNPIAWYLQRILYRLTGFLLVLPPERPLRNNVRFEAEALERLGALGLKVPRVLYVTDQYFVMSQVGRNLEVILRENPAKASQLIEKATSELRGFHRAGLAHGGAQIKNMTVNEGEIYFIDFEESIPERHLANFQLRDLFLFIFSLERTGHDPDLAAICRVYDDREDAGTLEKIRRALLQLRGVCLAERTVFDRYSMRDVRSLIRLIHKAKALQAGGTND